MSILKKQTVKQLIRTAFSLGIIWFLSSSIDFKMLHSSFTEIRPLWMSMVFVLLVPNMLVRTYRWLLLFNNHFFSITFYSSLKLLMTGMYLNLILPANMGDIAKSYFGYQWSGVKERMLSISVLDKVVALGSVCLMGLPFAIYQNYYQLVLLALFVIISAHLFFLFPHWLHDKRYFLKIIRFITRCFNDRIDMSLVVKEARISTKKLVIAIILSVLGWLITYFQLFLIFQGLNIEISLFYVLAVAPFLTLVRLFPFTLQGLGTDELAFCFLFSQAGITYEDIIAAALLYRFFLLILPGITGAIFLLHNRPINDVHTKSIADVFPFRSKNETALYDESLDL